MYRDSNDARRFKDELPATLLCLCITVRHAEAMLL
jgi:hypothetical protein